MYSKFHLIMRMNVTCFARAYAIGKFVVHALFAAAVAGRAVFWVPLARAEAPNTTVAYQPMVSTGLAARHPFEARFVLDKSSDPAVPGYAIPAGTSIRFTFSGGTSCIINLIVN